MKKWERNRKGREEVGEVATWYRMLVWWTPDYWASSGMATVRCRLVIWLRRQDYVALGSNGTCIGLAFLGGRIILLLLGLPHEIRTRDASRTS